MVCRTGDRVWVSQKSRANNTKNTPEGSLRWESVAKSSAVSNKGGLRRGGNPSLPSLISFPVVFMVISYSLVVEKSLGPPLVSVWHTFPRSSTKTSLMLSSTPFVTWVTSADNQACSLSSNQTLVPLLYMFSAMPSVGYLEKGLVPCARFLVDQFFMKLLCTRYVWPNCDCYVTNMWHGSL